jgi:hypothetical protein
VGPKTKAVLRGGFCFWAVDEKNREAILPAHQDLNVSPGATEKGLAMKFQVARTGRDAGSGARVGWNAEAGRRRTEAKSWWASYKSILCKDLDASLGGSIVIHHSSRWSG